MIAVIVLFIGVFGYLIICEICDYLRKRDKKKGEDEQMSEADITVEEIMQLNSQIVRNFGIDSSEAEMIIKSFENFGKKFEELV